MDDTTAALIEELKQAIADLEDGSGDQAPSPTSPAASSAASTPRPRSHDDDDTLGEDLREGAIRFEADHPRLADTIRRVIDGARRPRHLTSAVTAPSSRT